ncbi:hypothetical protein LJ739_01915 [Aestuariibacter halophilus]|uniref:Uncharacterized protein n=1 Tax=Fluctibacter halophilus TaxID=226011 RepID=A0ABS8G4D5_9ALTE|nr:hypothetical protein [Aestuariibacter halophilus]MCC2614996.1 hypothetical protein [Aestuariibacter halophilus]
MTKSSKKQKRQRAAITPQPDYHPATVSPAPIKRPSALAQPDYSGTRQGAAHNPAPPPAVDPYLSHYATVLSTPLTQPQPLIPQTVMSGLMYIVLEQELTLRNKRRIVLLDSNDLLYGSVGGKCVMLSIDWQKDWHNVVKVHEGKHTWETSFAELAATQDIALLRLFAHSEVWAEGTYAPLA